MDDAQKAAARDRAKDRLFENIFRLEDEVARLRAGLAASQARELRMRGAMRMFVKEAESYGEAWARCYVADFDRVASDSKEQRFRLLAVARDRLKSVGESMVEPIDWDSALLEMIEVAKAEVRESCAKAREGLRFMVLQPTRVYSAEEICAAQKDIARHLSEAIRARKV